MIDRRFSEIDRSERTARAQIKPSRTDGSGKARGRQFSFRRVNMMGKFYFWPNCGAHPQPTILALFPDSLQRSSHPRRWMAARHGSNHELLKRIGSFQRRFSSESVDLSQSPVAMAAETTLNLVIDSLHSLQPPWMRTI